ncbi:PadR family transcriptional regulator [Glycomyces sp. NRRL B-16210]|uniref:PadR family transcriptional regulator n=1 Tax=Glycomyces sp. NRRL B-16210 TaxID=1463821 RepID=UPI0004BFA52F|nr:PadR family transcriptional regulator [Glycomyces sp. NRRL B-16210]
MSVKHSLLALLERGPAYGYQLRAAFESATGNTWPLNIGQVYTTLNRLERDELVEAMPENDSGQRPYRITEAGRRQVAGWFSSPVQAADRPRDELTIKLALAVTTPGVDVADVVQRQRSATLRLLQEFTRLKAAEDHAELAWQLVLESMIFRAEAEIRWLDHTEAVVARADLPAPSPFGTGDVPNAADSADRERTPVEFLEEKR